MVGGETYNGLELWRRLYVENKGGAEQVVMAGLRRLHNFPQCPDKTKLGTRLGEWMTLVRAHGHSYSEESLFIMLTSMLPEYVAKEVRDRKSVPYNTDEIIEYLHGELARFNDKYLSTIQDSHELGRLESGPKNAVNFITDAEKRMSDIFKKFESTVAAFQRRGNNQGSPTGGGGGGGGAQRTSTLPKPDSSFKGCRHCGKSHPGGRTQCPDFKAILKRNGGKLPSDYEGAYERSLKQAGQPVNAVVAQEDAAALQQEAHEAPVVPGCSMFVGDEHPETIKDDMFFALVDSEPKDFTHSTQWDAFADLAAADEDGDADHSDVLAALSQISSSITVGRKGSQKQRRAAVRGPPRLSKQQIAALAEKINNG